ncbi:MAG: LysR family transcriptional regulator [Alphaproteobacteria bacterium]|nr:LysR family transcriptional regulator [Alphaproteobacteria bacterium]
MHAAILRYLETVAREGSIRKAAERLNISASAINRQILKLEYEFGTPLFERRPNGMALTESGRLAVAHARDTLASFERLKGEVDALRGIVSGVVTINTLDSLAVQFLPETLAQFNAAHPTVEIRVLSCDPGVVIQNVAQGEADIGLTFGQRMRVGVKVLHDIPCALCAIMTPDHPLADRSQLTLGECAAYPMVSQDNIGSMQRFFGDEMDRFKRTKTPVLTSNTLALLKRLILRGVGIAFYTRLGFAEELAAGRLKAIPLTDDRLASLRLSLIVSSERSPTIAAKTMADHMRDALARFSVGLDGGGK